MLHELKTWLLTEIEGDTRLDLIIAILTIVGCPTFLLFLCS